MQFQNRNGKILAAPNVNMNGTSKNELKGQLLDAHRALAHAIEALLRMSPHGRDYQTCQTSDDYELARNQHNQRIVSLGVMRDDIEEIASKALYHLTEK